MKAVIFLLATFCSHVYSAHAPNYRSDPLIEIDDQSLRTLRISETIDNLIDNNNLRELRIELSLMHLLPKRYETDQLFKELGRLLNTSSTLKAFRLEEKENQGWHRVKAPLDARAIFRSLITKDTLETLSFSVAGIGNRGALALAELIEKNHALREIRICPEGNKLKPKSIAALANAIRSNTTLKTFELKLDSIRIVDAHLLVGALKQNQSLTHITIICRSRNQEIDTLLEQANRINQF